MNRKGKMIERGRSIRPRKKIWELDTGYHCSVIGVCLRRAALRKLAGKKVFAMPPGSSYYQIHSILVNLAINRSPESRALHKFLDSSYRPAVNRYARAGNDEEIRKLWEADMQVGEVAGAYWAAMTHPFISSECSSFVYGQAHMMGYALFESRQRERLKLEKIRRKVKVLAEEKEPLTAEIEELRGVQGEAILVSRENEALKKQLEEARAASSESAWHRKLEERKAQVRVLRQDNASLWGRVDGLSTELETSNKMLQQIEGHAQDLERENADLRTEKEVLEQEIVSLEAALIEKMTVSCECPNCEDQDTERCPGPDLCGKTVLYVGGLHKMVPRYKELVEKQGGRFIHHDGGREASRTMLPEMLGSADAVFCPVDCVSHDACKRVKKICKQYQKPFIMMRSSGLSSLARGLGNIVQ